MKTATLLAAVLTVALLWGCKAKTPPPPIEQAPDPVKVELARMAATTDQLSRDNAELHKALRAMIQREQDNNALSTQLDQATKTAADLQNANARLNSALIASETKLQQAAADSKLAGDKAQAARLDVLEAEHKALVKQNEELTSRMESLRNFKDAEQARQMAKLQQEWAEAQEQMATMQAQNAMLIWAMQQRAEATRVYVESVNFPWWQSGRTRSAPPRGGEGGGNKPIHPGNQNPSPDNGGRIKSGPTAIDQNKFSVLATPGDSQTGHDSRSIRERSLGTPSAGGDTSGRFSRDASGAGRTQTWRVSSDKQIQASMSNGGPVTQGSNTSGTAASIGPSRGPGN